MGSWSVYCNFSKITISDEHECVLIPLLPHFSHTKHVDSKLWALPIYGRYTDSGRIYKIEETETTRIIEKTFGCTIQEFCDKLTDPNFNDEPEEWWHNEVESLEYCWVHREVWEYLSEKTHAELMSNLYELLKIDKFFLEEDNRHMLEDIQASFLENKSDYIANELKKVANVVVNSRRFSEYIKPYVKNITLQGGDYVLHQKYLHKFSEINFNILKH
jgi:hypothetical protein